MTQEINFPIYPTNNTPIEKPRGGNHSIVKLLRAASRHIDAKTATYVHIKKLERLKDTQGRVSIRATTQTTDPKNTPPTRLHYVSIRAKDPNYKGKLWESPAVIVDCTCPRHVYVWEFANWYNGASMMLRCNGEYPEQTNPGLAIGLCKHAIALGIEILRRKI